MDYSRRQLEALGEPFGESATRLKPGGRVYGGGGGGSAPPANTTNVQTSYTYPPEVRGDVIDLAKNAVRASKTEYQPYMRERIAGFDPFQVTAQQAVANLGPAQQIGAATQFAGAAGLRAGDINYIPSQFQTGSFTQPGAAESYMSPYYQNVVDIQAREARRQSDIERTKQQAQAVGQGAFGGSRSAIVEAERQRNLGQQLGDIQARGSQAAYEQAQNLYSTEQQRALEAQRQTEASRQYGAGLSLQGLQQQLSAAGQLGQLGQTQFGQQRDIINALQNIGAQYQQLEQQRLSQQYEDFLRQKRYPYEQLAFAKEMIAGVPTQTTQQVYQAPPSLLSQAAGLGLAAYGLFGTGKAEGGKIDEYEDVERPAGLGELALRNAQMKARR
jgi:hypothetical protein